MTTPEGPKGPLEDCFLMLVEKIPIILFYLWVDSALWLKTNDRIFKLICSMADSALKISANTYSRIHVSFFQKLGRSHNDLDALVFEIGYSKNPFNIEASITLLLIDIRTSLCSVAIDVLGARWTSKRLNKVLILA